MYDFDKIVRLVAFHPRSSLIAIRDVFGVVLIQGKIARSVGSSQKTPSIAIRMCLEWLWKKAKLYNLKTPSEYSAIFAIRYNIIDLYHTTIERYK